MISTDIFKFQPKVDILHVEMSIYIGGGESAISQTEKREFCDKKEDVTHKPGVFLLGDKYFT
jgi:hypothetical protein